jgi:hypothetical protein
MRASCFLAAAAIVSLSADPAAACMAVHIPQAVVFDRPPAKRPQGYAVFKVALLPHEPSWGPFPVLLKDPAQARRFGRIAWLEPEGMSSCTELGRQGSDGYVVARPQGKAGKRTLMRAKIYSRSWWDRFWSNFGWTRFTADGEMPVRRP